MNLHFVDPYHQYLCSVKNTDMEGMCSQAFAHINFSVSKIELSGIIFRKEFKLRGNHTSDSWNPHQTTMGMSADTYIRPPFCIFLCKHRIVCHQNLYRVLLCIPSYVPDKMLREWVITARSMTCQRNFQSADTKLPAMQYDFFRSIV